MLKWLGRIVVFLGVIAIIGWVWKGEELKRLLAVNSLFSEEKIVNNFSNMDTMFLNTSLTSSGDVSELPVAATVTLPDGTEDWLESRSATALVVLKDGAVVFEDYYQGTGEDDLRISWSMAKSWLSALFGILLEEGAIGSVDDPVTQYAPSLVGSAYDGATIKDVLQMSSGVVFDEDYLDYDSDINKMGRVLALGGSMDEFAAGLTETYADPGETWQYVSIDTHVLGMVVRGATGRSLTDLLSEKIAEPMGLEAAPYYLTDGYGVAFALGGLNMKSRDYARFGQMIANGGRWNDQQIVPEAWVEESTAPSAPTQTGETRYGYQWWIPVGSDDGQFMARGIYDQYTYIDPSRNVVIVLNAANRSFREAGVGRGNEEMFRQIAESLE